MMIGQLSDTSKSETILSSKIIDSKERKTIPNIELFFCSSVINIRGQLIKSFIAKFSSQTILVDYTVH